MHAPLINWLPDERDLRRKVYAECEDANTPTAYDTHFVMLDEHILTIGTAKHCGRFVAAWGEDSRL